ncbi:MAG: DUF302 domain-containing protein [Candidatus Marinimicrobia bacterium]|nr:DUF302 domain-containing protein [Candidatus Neomarinimicrobiota bacterium]MCF7827978.1 DUF302 domain-containing protein [Candidatus Neomarinimicrobiota bacterium]MCF7879267.1 DUF302 domain-containing protein [Candidatus Neomarinimicrobiota bacterium]
MQYGHSRTVNLSYDDALERVQEELKERGFGVLTEVDVKATMKEKLDEDMNNYKILGACNPPFAHEALQMETELGLLLPCNVIVYTNDDGETVISSIDANTMLSVVDNPEMDKVASQVTELLQDAVNAVADNA